MIWHSSTLPTFGGNGQSVGPSDGSHRGTWTVQTVPEPPTIVLVAAGLLAVGGGLWRRRRSI